MKLGEIVRDFPTKDKFNGDIEITNLNFDCNVKSENSLFFCLNSKKEKCCEKVKRTIADGAVAVVCENLCDAAEGTEVVLVENIRQALSVFAANFYSNPEKELKIIGVVGTNGKTSICHLLGKIFNELGYPSAVIGTLGAKFEDYNEDVGLTTPDPTTLFKCLRKLKSLGAEYVFMEVSAHAIFFEKVYPIKFESLIFTNCTQDHLDFFKTMEEYKSVKKSIFKKGVAEKFIVNSDDALGVEIYNLVNAYTYALNSPCDVFAMRIKEKTKGLKFVLNAFDEIYEVEAPLYGLFNVYNLLAVLTAAKLEGLPLEKVVRVLKTIGSVEGRMEKVATHNGADIYVDYAHTPDGLEKCLTAVRKITKGDVYVLFGCGGNRDKTKRKIMGRIAGDIADYVIITSDNPRYEDANAIIRDVESGVRESSLDYIAIEDRKKAICYAIRNLSQGDALLIAGKGAERYQEIMGVKHQFSDKEVVLGCVFDS